MGIKDRLWERTLSGQEESKDQKAVMEKGLQRDGMETKEVEPCKGTVS
jgi:hypothetical protein